MFTREYIRTFRASTERSCMSTAFLIKLRVVYYSPAALLRHWSTTDFFSKNTFFVLFKQLVFGTFSKKSLWLILFIAKLQSELVYYSPAALLRHWSTTDFFSKNTFFILFKQLVFGTFSKKSLWLILFIAKLQSELITWLKETLS